MIMWKIFISLLWGSLLLYLVIGAWKDWKATNSHQHNPFIAIAFMGFVYFYSTYNLWTKETLFSSIFNSFG